MGRATERAALDRVLGAARDGMSGALVLRGEPGIGKTSLLDYAANSAHDFRVLRLLGIESEMELGFAALHQLLVPLLGELDNLPAPQRSALRSAFGLAEADAPDRLMVGLAALTLLAAAAAKRPLLCIVDDAQWLDHESAQALGFVARRLYADRIAMLFVLRDGIEQAESFEVAAFAPDDGETILDIIGRFPESALGSALRPVMFPVVGHEAGTELAIDPALFPTVFGADLPSDVTAAMAIAQRPAALDAFAVPAGPPAWRSLPSWSIVATSDEVIHPAAQRAMANRAGAFTIEIDASHSVAVSQPAGVADLIRTAARSCASAAI